MYGGEVVVRLKIEIIFNRCFRFVDEMDISI